jgi:hypothetical protein
MAGEVIYNPVSQELPLPEGATDSQDRIDPPRLQDCLMTTRYEESASDSPAYCEQALP